MKDKWDKIEIICESIGLLTGTALLVLGIIKKDLYMFLGSYLVYLYLIKESTTHCLKAGACALVD